jgi:phosphatidylinositol alpha-1,6-mannosyltransferase
MLPAMVRPRVVLCADSLQSDASGIGRVARLVARVLGKLMHSRVIDVEALVLRDQNAATDIGIPVRCAAGSRARLAYELHRAALHSSHFIYDVTGIARAHPMIPWLPRPYMVWMHGIEVWESARSNRLSRARNADMLVANSDYTRARAMRLHDGLSHSRVCWLATEDAASDVHADGYDATSCNVLILSRIDEGGGYKGHRELIAAWPQVVNAAPHARLLIAGDGPGMSVVRAWADTSPARDRIELLGFVDQAAIGDLWKRAALFAMPSRGEGFGIAYVEAMRHAVPVIGSIHDAASEVNAAGESGYNVDLDRPGALAECLARLLCDVDERRRLSAAGHARWRAHFAYDVFTERFERLLDEFLDRPKQHGIGPAHALR